MKYYINKNKKIFGIDTGQEKLIQSDWVEITLEEIEAIDKAKEEEYKQSLEYRLQESKTYLSSTDYKMTVDYFATLSQDVQDELIRLRAEARKFIRENE